MLPAKRPRPLLPEVQGIMLSDTKLQALLHHHFYPA